MVWLTLCLNVRATIRCALLCVNTVAAPVLRTGSPRQMSYRVYEYIRALKLMANLLICALSFLDACTIMITNKILYIVP